MPFIFLIILSFSSISRAEMGVPSATDIANFHQVDVDLFRGARPTSSGLQWLAQHHIKTVINLEDRTGEVELEQFLVKKDKMQFLNFGMSGIFTPIDETVNAALAAVANPALRPIYIHCRFGRDRTGLIVALYRVRFEKWTPRAAYNELLQDGMSDTSLLAILPYFERATGFHP